MEASAEKKVPEAVPDKSKTTLEFSAAIFEKAKTHNAAMREPKKAPAETEGRARDLFKNDSAENGKNPAITAPKVAPEEMPIILESARGFLKKP